MIEINNLTADKIDKNFLKKVAKIVLKSENIDKEKGISIALIPSTEIKKLNQKYRKKDKTTDVLAFTEDSNHKFNLGLGEIVICIADVKKNAKKFNSDFKKELSRVLIHGILHLLGYDHEKSKKAGEKMEKKQEHYLSQI